MTAQYNLQRETIDLLERILERVESIDKNVEDLRDDLGDRFGDFTYRHSYNGTDDKHEYE
jgi:hypothetical protein